MIRWLYLWEQGRACDMSVSNELGSGLVLIRIFLPLSKDGLALSKMPRQSWIGTKCTWHSLFILLRKIRHSVHTGGGWWLRTGECTDWAVEGVWLIGRDGNQRDTGRFIGHPYELNPFSGLVLNINLPGCEAVATLRTCTREGPETESTVLSNSHSCGSRRERAVDDRLLWSPAPSSLYVSPKKWVVNARQSLHIGT